ncbi:unnamed protein product [Amoebophrya sp. A120]|nr:unnamed protein product [Amoebophrya sp. A120]|eukprot:GSA120T00003230001.1
MAAAVARQAPYRWGICSTGNICNDFVTCLQYLKQKKGRVEVAAVAARSLEKAQQFADKFSIPSAYASYTDMFKDPNIDVIYVGAIHPMHKQIVLEALRNKKHVLCEKPMGMNLQEVLSMQSAALESNCLLQEAMWTRFTPLTKKVRELVQEQRVLGDLKFIQGDFGVQFPRSVKRIWDRDMGGGALLDIGIYPLQFLSGLLYPRPPSPEQPRQPPDPADLPQPKSCKVEGSIDAETGVDTAGVFSATYENDITAVVSWNALCQTPEELMIAGTKGCLRIHSPAHCATKATLSIQENRESQKEEKIEIPLPPDMDRSKFNFPNSELIMFEAEAVCDALDKGRLECADYGWAETRHVTGLMDMIRKELGVVYPSDKEVK